MRQLHSLYRQPTARSCALKLPAINEVILTAGCSVIATALILMLMFLAVENLAVITTFSSKGKATSGPAIRLQMERNSNKLAAVFVHLVMVKAPTSKNCCLR